MSKSKFKLPYISKEVLSRKKNIWKRDSMIPSFLINKTVNIHNGKEFKKLFINKEKIGYKFGEFISTRKPRKKKI